MSKELSEILNDLDRDVMTGFLDGYADRLDSEGSNKILILDINRTDLFNEDDTNILETGSVEYGDWESLSSYISQDDIVAEKKESEAYIKEVRDGCDCGELPCECDYRFHRAILYCEGKYVWSINSYWKSIF